jgi:hypothetical protein
MRDAIGLFVIGLVATMLLVGIFSIHKTNEVIVANNKTSGGCIYKTSSGALFSDNNCRYSIGEEIDPYYQRSTYKSKHSH